MSFDCGKVFLLVFCQYVFVFVNHSFWLFLGEHLIEFFWIELFQANVCHVHGFGIVLGGKNKLFIPVLQVCNVVVADSNGLVVLTIKEYARLCEIDCGDNV